MKKLSGAAFVKEYFKCQRTVARLSFVTTFSKPPVAAFFYGSNREISPRRNVREESVDFDAIQPSNLKRGKSAKSILAHASHHNKMLEVGTVKRSDDLDKVINLFTKAAAPRLLAIGSRLDLNNGETAHIPMLDFGCPVSSQNLRTVKEVIKALKQEGFILNSGKSYHFYGIKLLQPNELDSFLGRALLFSPIIDSLWIAHQLIEKSCALRISSKPGRVEIPYVVSRPDQ